MKMLSIILLIGIQVAGYAAETAKIPWNSEVSKDYTVWRWMETFTDDDHLTWDDLDAEHQAAAVSKAIRACGKAHAKLSSTRGQTNGDAILAMTEGDLEYLGACFTDGEATAAALQGKRSKLAAIKAKADKGIYDEADMAWLKARNITLAHQPAKGKEDAKLAEERTKKQEKTAATAKKKYDKMKGLDEEGLREAYSGALKKKGSNDDTVYLSKAKLTGAPPKPEARDPKKKLTSMAPPDIGTGGKPAKAPKLKGIPSKDVVLDGAYGPYDFKFSKLFDSNALKTAQDRAQDEKLIREGQVGVGIATREEHAKITKALTNHSIIGGVLPAVYDFVPGGVVADCLTGGCTQGSGAYGKVVQIVTGTKSKREVGGGYYTKTELACAALGDIAGDLDAYTFGLTKKIPLPAACNKKNGAK